jgi:hypothetical protein
MTIRSRFTAAFAVAVVALSSVAGAAAMAKPRAATTAHPKVTKKTTSTTAAARKTGGTTVVKPPSGGSAVAMISAFPTGGKGSGTEATCALWTKALQAEQQAVDDAPEPDKQDAAGPLNQDIDNAMDAGCAVIY